MYGSPRSSNAFRFAPTFVTGDFFLDDAISDELRALGVEVCFKPLWIEDLASLVREQRRGFGAEERQHDRSGLTLFSADGLSNFLYTTRSKTACQHFWILLARTTFMPHRKALAHSTAVGRGGPNADGR